MGLHKLDRNTGAPAGASLWQIPGVMLAVALLLTLLGETARKALRFERSDIASGEVWRLLTGHFVHLGWRHFALNAAGLVLVWFLVGDSFRRTEWLFVALFSVATMDLGLWYFDPALQWYVGLSGLLHGLLAAGLVEKLRKPDIEMIALAVLLLAKLAWEQLGGPLPGSESAAGGAVVVDAHLFGALGGVLAAMAMRIRVRSAPPI